MKIVVGENFEDLVKNNDKDVLVLFYDPDCDQCKDLMPIFEEAAEIVKKNMNIRLAKIDYTKNEFGNIQVDNFPKLYYFENGAKFTNKEFDQNKDLNGIIKFLKMYTSHDWVNIEHLRDDL